MFVLIFVWKVSIKLILKIIIWKELFFNILIKSSQVLIEGNEPNIKSGPDHVKNILNSFKIGILISCAIKPLTLDIICGKY